MNILSAKLKRKEQLKVFYLALYILYGNLNFFNTNPSKCKVLETC